jgi:hypothetical protein
MSSQVRTFDPALVVCIIGGAAAHGYADGSFIKIERGKDAFSKYVGADGEVSRAKSNDRSGVLTLTLDQTSPYNDILSGYALLDEVDNDGVVPVAIKDLSGNSTFFSGHGWVRKMPDVEYSTEIGTREWVIELAQINYFVGGND